MKLTIRWLGQGGYLLSDGKTKICIDPYLSDLVERLYGRKRLLPAALPPEELVCDTVICTHNHADHLDTDAIVQMRKEKILFLAPKDAEHTLRACGVENYVSFDAGATYRIGDFQITAVYAKHTVPAVGIMLRHEGITLYFSGDTEYEESLETLARWKPDVTVICINGKLGNMGVAEAVRLTRALAPKVAIPTHYGMFASNTEDPERYTSQLPCAVALAYNQTYSVKELIKHV